MGCGCDHTDQCGSAVFGGIQREIGRMEVGIECDRSGGQLWDTDVAVSGDAGTGSVHVRNRTVERGPRVVR